MMGLEDDTSLPCLVAVEEVVLGLQPQKVSSVK
jgi:hypothetical protein